MLTSLSVMINVIETVFAAQLMDQAMYHYSDPV